MAQSRQRAAHAAVHGAGVGVRGRKAGAGRMALVGGGHTAAERGMHVPQAAMGAHGIAVARPSARVAGRSAARAVVAAAVAIALATGAGLGLASAGGSAQQTMGSVAEPTPSTEMQVDLTVAAALSQSSTRDVSDGVAEIAAEEEAARVAAEQAALEAERMCIAQAQAAQAKSAANGGQGVYAVDWSVGRDAFLKEWTARIDKYLAGSPLAGYGATFAEAAWNNGVDPRWSPAISNTESTKGRNCFAWHNAWGWTDGAWKDWPTAINAHIRGLADIYGYTISYANACKYCPPNKDNWYRDTLNEMQKI